MSWVAVGVAAVGTVGGIASSQMNKSNNSQSSMVPSYDQSLSIPIGSATLQARKLFGMGYGEGTPGYGMYSDPYSMYVGPNANQKNAANLQAQYASNFGLSNAGIGNITDTLNGKYLDPSSNPYLTNTFNMAADQVQGRVNSDFNKAGRYGSGLQSDTYQKNLNDLSTQIYGGNYQNERNRQIQALGLAPSVAGLPFVNTQAMMNAGAQQQSWDQARVNAPLDRLNTINSFFKSQSPGATQTQNTPYYTNPLNSALGFGLGAYGLMNKGQNDGSNTNWWGGQDYDPSGDMSNMTTYYQ